MLTANCSVLTYHAQLLTSHCLSARQLVSEVSTSDSVRTKFLSSALEALLGARQKLGAAGRTATPLDAALTQLGQRVTLNRHVRRLVNQLTQLAKRSVQYRGAYAARRSLNVTR